MLIPLSRTEGSADALFQCFLICYQVVRSVHRLRLAMECRVGRVGRDGNFAESLSHSKFPATRS